MAEDVQLSVVGVQKVFEMDFKESVKLSKEYIYYTKNQAYKKIFDDSNFFGFPVNKLYRKELLEQIGKEIFNEKVHMCEDTLMNCSYLKKCSKIAHNQSKLYYYFQRKDSATKNQVFNEKKLTVFESLNQIEKILKENSKSNLVYLYIFYLYNYYLLQILLYKNNKKYKFDRKKIKKVYKYVMKSKKISTVKKIKIFIKYNFPIINYRMVDIVKSQR